MTRPVFALRVRALPGGNPIRNLRAWLKRGLRDFNLRCVDIHQEPERAERESVMAKFSLNDADDLDLLPAKIYRLKISAKGGSAGREDGLRNSAKVPRLLQLELVYTVIGGEHAGRKIWDTISVGLDQDETLPPLDPKKNYHANVGIGRSRLKAILDSHYALDPHDHSPEADAKRDFDKYDEKFDGLIFWAQVEIKKQDGYKPKNIIDFVITPDLPDWPKESTQPKQAIVPRKSVAQDLDDEVPFN